MPEELTAEQKTEIAIAQKAIQDQLDAPRDLRELLEIEKKAAAKPTEEESKKIELDKASLDKATDLLGDRLGFRPAKKKEAVEEKKAELDAAAKAEADKKAEEDKATKEAAEKVKEKKVPIRKKVAPPEIDPVQVATDAARAVVAEFKPAPAKPEPALEDEVPLSAEEKDELAVFKEMGASNPEYKDLAKQYVQSIKRIEDYKQKWEKENPEETFDPNDEAHDTFYDRITPSFNERDFRKAEARMAAKELVEKTTAKSEGEQAQLKAELAKKELEPTIYNAKLEAAATVLNSINPEYTKLVEAEKDGFKKFQEQDPLAAHALVIAAQRLSGFIEAAHQIDEPQSRIRIDGNNPAHREYVSYLMGKEDEMKAQPLKEQFDEQGRKFATRREIIGMPQAERARHWYFTDKALIELRIAEEAYLAKDFIEKENERLEKIAKTRGWKTDSASQSTQTKPADTKKKEEKPATAASTIKSPEAPTGGTVDTTANNGKKVDEDFLSQSAEILFRR